jgi:NitT/TauT family transport system ATP-binding protein
MTDLVVQDLHKSYPNGKCAIRQLSFRVVPGEFVAIVGPSGSGKSSLLKILCGLDRDFTGLVQPMAPEHTRLVFQEPRLMPWLTVLQNLQLVRPDAAQDALLEMLQNVGLAHCAALFPHQLSGGMQRRVALARAFITAPQLLLMDEPFQSLDAPTAAQLREQLLTLWQRCGCTVLFVTHQLSEAVALADRILFLSEGPSRVLQDLALPLPRPRNVESPAVQALCQQLLLQHPDLLRGICTL